MSVIKSEFTEIDRVYSKLRAAEARCVAVCAANTGEGVSTIVAALAQRAVRAGRRVLVVDLASHAPVQQSILPDETINLSWSGLVDLAQDQGEGRQPSGVWLLPAPPVSDVPRLRDPAALAVVAQLARRAFDLVIFDCVPLLSTNTNNVPAESLASVADATLFVVHAANTPGHVVSAAVEILERRNVTLFGAILNDRDNPNLAAELIRETHRFDRILPGLMRRLRKTFQGSSFLNAEV